jgi:hypothetical protein
MHPAYHYSPDVDARVAKWSSRGEMGRTRTSAGSEFYEASIGANERNSKVK